MEIQPFIFILLILSVVGLAVVILFIIQSYNHFFRRVAQFEEEKTSLHDALTQKASNIIKDAHEKHASLLADNHEKVTNLAQEALLAADPDSIGADRKAFQEKLDKLLAEQRASVERISLDFQKYYKDALAKVASDDVESITKLSKDIETEAAAEMQEFAKTLRTETVDARKVMQEHIEEEYAKVERDIAEYKKQEIGKIEQALYPLLAQVTQMVIGRSLDPKEHEKLIQDAIAEAARELDKD